MITESIVRAMLMDVIDPEMGVSIVDMGLIYKINIEDGLVKIDMTLTNAGCPLGPEIVADIKRVLKGLSGVTEVTVNIVWTPIWNPEMMSDEAKEMLSSYFPGFKIG